MLHYLAGTVVRPSGIPSDWPGYAACEHNSVNAVRQIKQKKAQMRQTCRDRKQKERQCRLEQRKWFLWRLCQEWSWFQILACRTVSRPALSLRCNKARRFLLDFRRPRWPFARNLQRRTMISTIGCINAEQVTCFFWNIPNKRNNTTTPKWWKLFSTLNHWNQTDECSYERE